MVCSLVAGLASGLADDMTNCDFYLCRVGMTCARTQLWSKSLVWLTSC